MPDFGRVIVGGYGPRDAEVVLLGQSPGREEEQQGQPFVGPAGRYVQACFEEAGYDWSRVYRTNVFRRRLLATSPEVIRRHVDRERENVARELRALRRMRLLVCVGNEALYCATGLWGIRSHHGRVLKPELLGLDAVCLCVVHPAFVLRDGGKESLWHRKLVDALRLGQNLLARKSYALSRS